MQRCTTYVSKGRGFQNEFLVHTLQFPENQRIFDKFLSSDLKNGQIKKNEGTPLDISIRRCLYLFPDLDTSTETHQFFSFSFWKI